MRPFGKANLRSKTRDDAAQSKTFGAELPEIVQRAVERVLAEGGADRAGIWWDSNSGTAGDSRFIGLRGVVIDRSEELAPAEWKWLSPEASLPHELFAGEAVESEWDAGSQRVAIGALIDMRRALWVPIQTNGVLRGVVLAAARNKHTVLHKAAVQGVAAEVAMSLALEGERRLAQLRQQDIALVRQMLPLCTSQPEMVLQNLVESCIQKHADDIGPVAICAAVGEITNTAVGEALRPEAATGVGFSWRSGGPFWTSALEAEPVASIWRQALEARQVTGSDPKAGGFGEVGRVVAFPLEADGQSLGVMVAGLQRENVSLATMERLELRAAVATQALLQLRQRRESERQYSCNEALLAESSDAVVVLGPGGKIAGLSGKARELLKPRDGPNLAASFEAENSPDFASIFHPREHQRIADWLKSEASPKNKHSRDRGQLEVELANGTMAQIHAVGSGTDPAAVFLETLRPRKIDPQAAQAETELRNVIEWLEEGVLLFGARQEIRAMNSRFAQIAGLTPEDSVGVRTLHGLISSLAPQTAEPDNFAARWLALAHGTESGTREEVHLLRPAPRVLERIARPVLDAAGGRLGRVEIYRDLTAQRKFHSKLLQTEKLAALGQMLTSIAHELSNPLTSILGYAQRLVVRNDSAGRPSAARQILQEAERASAILRQLLLTARDARPERGKVQLNEVVTRTMELQRFGLAAEKVNVKLDLDPALPLVTGDAGQLQQVLMNLMGNARQAIEQGGKRGTIRLRTKPAGESRVLLEVTDDGPGIPQSILAKIFDPFFTTKPAGIGTGLGLSIVLGIVREHGGEVRAANASGGGATFSIELPAANADSARDKRGLAAAYHGEPTGHEQGVLAPRLGSAVLVVEDEATVARLIADVLEDEGLHVDVLLDVREAFRRATSEKYDLVICDMKMPGVDGEQFFEVISRISSAWRPPMLFVTGDVLAARTREFLERHHLPHLAKPFRVEELTEKVRQVLAQASPAESQTEKSKVARN